MIRVALVDDHSLFRRGMKLLLSSHPDIEVVAEVASGEEFLDVVGHISPDVVFMDYSMPGMNGAEATERALAKLPSLKVIALSMYGENAYYTRMMECGAKGFLLKDSPVEEVFSAIESVMNDEEYICSEVMQAFSRAMLRKEENDLLSEREIDVLLGICRGLSTQEIADKLFLSKRTVDTHRANILEKTGSNNTASLVVYAIKNNLVEI